MKRMAALLAVLGALSGVVPATAIAETRSDSCMTVILLRLC